MNLEELAETLPNGFHDSEVSSLHIDYPSREVTVALSIWIGDLSSHDPDTREAYRPGLLKFSGMRFCAIEPPDPRYPYKDAGTIRIDSGKISDLKHPTRLPLPEEGDETFTCWIFVDCWNAFIYISALEASLTWSPSIIPQS